MENNINKAAQPYELRQGTLTVDSIQPSRAWYQVDGTDRALNNSGSLNPFILFQRITNIFPDNRRYEGKLDMAHFMQKFSERFPEAWQNGVYTRNFRQKDGRYEVEEATWWLGGNILVSMRNFEFEKSLLVLFSYDSNMSMLQSISLLAESCPAKKARQQIHLIALQRNEYQLRNFEVQCPEIDMQKHYPDGFEAMHENLVEALNKPDQKGIVLLHGQPGTGKTTYLRYMISILKKKVIYLPPDMADIIARPDFIAFLLEHPGAVLVIEDAERVVEQRGRNSSTAISNLLNLCDGLLADCLSIQVVCTFNMPLVNVDKALLRKGRLLTSYEFSELNVKKSNALLSELHNASTADPMTLADIIHYNGQIALEPKVKVIGF